MKWREKLEKCKINGGMGRGGGDGKKWGSATRETNKTDNEPANVGIVAHVQGADVELQLGLLAKTFIAVSTRVATPLMHFANVSTHVPGALELLVTLSRGG